MCVFIYVCTYYFRYFVNINYICKIINIVYELYTGYELNRRDCKLTVNMLIPSYLLYNIGMMCCFI